MLEGVQETLTDVIVGEDPLPPPLLAAPPPHADANRSGTLRRSAQANEGLLFAEFRHGWKVIFHSPTNLRDL